MFDITTGFFQIDPEKGYLLRPQFSRRDFIESPLYQEAMTNQQCTTKGNHCYRLENIVIGNEPMQITLHFDRNDYMDRIVLKSLEAANTITWSQQESWKETASNIKAKQDALLLKECQIARETFPSEELRFDASWGSITSSMELTEEPEICLTIRYRNLSKEQQEHYLECGKRELYGKR